MMGCYGHSVIKHDKKYFRKNNVRGRLRRIIYHRYYDQQTKFYGWQLEKGFFFPPMENMDALLAVCKRMCAIKRLDQLAYARVKLFPTPLEKSRMFCLLHWCYLKKIKKPKNLLLELLLDLLCFFYEHNKNRDFL